ncbi:DUF58 domain-containing protein [Candidatus Formimonas warabiya]|uniref:Uncharacterized protein n=1 Tax=Formimonas warabiya TaxID=1761012 RepID=A0A3G1KXW1_FORW1|nr:DUF58 domain-containing protein [Candidatus Formimonas warabiya]ATW27199.1 hypothetical protein DCMF_22780 [Candidatus Formimonas warabiya]
MPNSARVHPYHGYVIFSDRGLWGLITLILIAVYWRYYPLAILVTLVALVWLLSRVWAKFALEGVIFGETATIGEVFPHTPVKVEISVGNKSPLPVPWLELEQAPSKEGGKVEEGSPYQLEEDGRRVCRLGWIFRHQNYTCAYVISFKRRGYFRFGTARLKSGDPFAFFARERAVKKIPELIVYPHLLPADRFELQRRDPLGEKADLNFLFTDPLLVTGIRDYQETDPLRRVNWKASARFHSLKSNIWEGKAAHRSCIFLETASLAARPWSPEKAEFAWEILLSSAATIAEGMTEKNQEWGFLTDVLLQPENPQPYFMAPASGNQRGRFFQLLSLLACLESGCTRIKPDQVFQAVSIPPGVTLIILSAASGCELHESLQTVAQRHKVIWMQLEPEREYEGVWEQISLIPGWEKDASLKEFLGLTPVDEAPESGPKGKRGNEI